MKASLSVLACLLCPALALAAETTVTLNLASSQGVGSAVGTVRIVETPYGLAFYPQLKGLPPGLHGFHVHEKPACTPADKDGVAIAALAAGGHFDPQETKRHGEPWGDGHLGDLPALYVAADGTASNPVLAPRLKLAEVRNRSLMLHAGGDNHSDDPAPLGGGGARVACGVIGG
ncbi:MAG: Superoxide dismutase [Cu-Zn] precursor [Candidatus Accumulibacter appositus]|mgnify:FL=1|uniref:Superoxide dismutase [Cu-Zn] n=1 Tax=Candidatus Accumulibacter appositus TaxID=1454003 RepID=A0A011PUU4_9PROT|nr:superoxide dismutase family protein [Accumulibacter sp.]EXI80590.1 MAG: Superoxide dismutase [Cu-Zn] precursor [Candidatus Accumulibacter appositus]HRF05630.1 superoxide dismutase [Cu-Zn] SodC [Accumulibacter sp.]